LTRFSLKNGAVVLIAMLMVIGGGIVSYLRIPNAEFPDVDVPWINVFIQEPGATPEQVYNDVAKVLEPKLSTITGLKKLYSFSSTGWQSFNLEFDMDRSNADIKRDINEVIASVKFPDAVQKPTISEGTISGDAIYMFSVSADSADIQDIQSYVDSKLKPALSAIDGVGDVKVDGVTKKNIYVELNADKMKKHGVTWQEVQQALVANNVSSPVGALDSDKTSMPIVVGNELTSLQQIRDVPIVLFKQNASGLTDAFRSVQSGFGAVSSAFGTIGKNEGVLQGEIQYMQAIQGLMAQLMQDYAQLQALQSQGSPTPDSQQQVAALQKKIAAEQQQIQTLQTQLGTLQRQLQAPSATGASTPALPSGAETAKLKAVVVKLGDIADVEYREDPTNATITRTNGKPGVVVRIVPAPHANTIQVVKDVQNTLHNIQLPAGFHTDELVNAADQVQHSVNGMVREALLGALFATIVTLLFLRDLRATVVALCSIPLSILAAIIVMNALHYTLNILTLSGIAVAVGRVVDDSIVVIENIYRRLKLRDAPGDEALVADATQEVGAAITSSTITTLAVFAPMTVVPGIVGHVFRPFAWTVIIALAFSLLVALMVVPLIAKLSLLRVKPAVHRENVLQRAYRRTLSWSLQHKWAVVVLSVLLLAESGFAATQVGFNFIPAGRVDMYVVNVKMPIASSLQAANQVTRQVEQILAQDEGVKGFQSFVDANSPAVYVTVKDSVKDTAAFAEDLRKRLKAVTGAKQITVAGNSGPGDNTVHLILDGNDYEQLLAASEQAQQALSQIPGLTDVSTSAQARMPQIKVVVDPVKAGHYGLDPLQVTGAVRNIVNGDTVTSVNYQGRTTDVNLMLGSGDITSLDELGRQKLLTPTGDKVELRQIATLSETKGPMVISRLNQQQFIQVTGTIVSDNQSAVTAKVDEVMNNLKLPPGVSFHQEGASEDMNQGFRNISIAMLVGFLLVLIVMLVTFGEWTAPLAIVFALPFALVGGLNGLWLAREPLGMPGMIGFMMLIGIIVTNAIVLMDRVQRQLRTGMSVRDALLEAGTVRLRPILMTATATVGALLPLTMVTDVGIISKSLAIVVIGGLTTSTLLTLVIVPIMYEWFCQIRARIFKPSKQRGNRAQYELQPLPGK
jgi:HAE1 family hydrophobic/amphiphilic exporter-1